MDRATSDFAAEPSTAPGLRQRMETALVESEQRRLLAVEAAGVGDWTYDVATRVLDCSPIARAMHRLAPGEPITIELHDALVHPDDRAAVQAVRAAAMDPAGSGHYRVEFRFRFANGDVRWIESVGQALFEESVDGRQATQVLGVMLDVTDRVRAHRAVKRAWERADRLRALTAALAATTTPEAAADIVVAQGVEATGAATGLLALRRSATRPESEGSPEPDDAIVLRQVGVVPGAATVAEGDALPLDVPGPAATCLRTGEAIFVESREALLERFPDAHAAWDAVGARALATVPLAVGGDAVGVMCFTWRTARALTAELQAFLLDLGQQAALAVQRARLFEAERSARAVAESAQRRAETIGWEAEAASQAKSAFLATMSHELRTPINAIMGYTQLLDLGLGGPLTEKQRAYVDRVTASSQHLLGLVNDVLDLSKIEAGEMVVSRTDAWTGPATRGALDLVRPLASSKGVRLVDRRPDDDEGVAYVGDEARVRQIVLNLLSNAVKFTPSGGEVSVVCDLAYETPADAARLHGEGPWAFVRVSDTGIGIPAEQQERIFEPFHQVEGGHTRPQGGTGLGLAISRRLARLMGGDLTVASAPGAGAAFTLWLPAARQDAGRQAESAADRSARAERERALIAATGLAELGDALRTSLDDVLRAYSERLRADGAVPGAGELRRAELEDHVLTFLADLAQSLVIVADAGPAAAELLRDGSAIQRTVAEHHGARRFAQGWDLAALRRDRQILREELERTIRGRLGAHPGTRAKGDADDAIALLLGLVDRAEAISVSAWRAASAARAATRR